MRLINWILGLVVLLVAISVFAGIYADWLWFTTIGYSSVFETTLFTNIGLGLLFGAVFFVFAYINLRIAKKKAMKQKKGKSEKHEMDKFFITILLVLAYFIGVVFSNWQAVLQFLNSTPFNVLDPLFSMDIGFYVFQLPFYSMILTYMFVTLILAAVLTIVAYVSYSAKKTESDEAGARIVLGDTSKMKKHLLVLAGIIFFLVSAAFFLGQYYLLFSELGVVVGAGYADIAVLLPLMQIMIVVSAVVGIMFMVSAFGKNLVKPGLAMFFIILLIGGIATVLMQWLVVKPNEFNFEAPYIERNINYTLAAYNLANVNSRSFPVSYNLTKDQLENKTIENIRVWDWRPLKTTYEQLQLFRTYYDFNDVDIDRYYINGEYRQLLVSGREFNSQDLPSTAKTWINQHLVYTHGYGVVASPVNDVVKEGLPNLYVKDIPPQSEYFNIERPEIYFGEISNDYVITRTTTKEFDYPSGNQNIYTEYAGTDGIVLDSLLKRLVYAINLGSIELLVSSSLTDNSRLHMYRNIIDRVDKVTPFLVYDSDPYLVIDNNRLYWIIDAYTVTDRYPYSDKIELDNIGDINYIRNPVKVVIDAYNGNMNFYVIDRSDPIINTYDKIFPGLFKEINAMPDGIKPHVRYPEGLFKIQSYVYGTYHMKDSQVFYNKEDVWQVPTEVYSSDRQQMTPYYIIMKLPGQDKEEFMLMIQENMIGWMAARSDRPGYGELVVYEFSKQELVYGPMQIEARIDQDTEISQKLTLWDQIGSKVIRGNILVIPVKDSILYVEPLYLQAVQTGSLPELKRVIVAYSNKVVMAETLEQALDQIFGQTPQPVQDNATALTSEQVIKNISELYNSAQQSLLQGNLTAYAQYVNQIGALVRDFEAQNPV
ncbi:MAG: UPF0182 family protein [Candidatus Aenigmarchaeota archaeon]|nr:UPF0182 family protein [Candidatus Aenigmarchaeota archaeon]